MTIHIKRVYEPLGPEDGLRILVDRLWPRGLSKERANLDCWAKDLAPSDELRRWFGHDPYKWEVFKTRYFLELEAKIDIIQEILEKAQHRVNLTLLYGAKDTQCNNVQALLEFLLEKPRKNLKRLP